MTQKSLFPPVPDTDTLLNDLSFLHKSGKLNSAAWYFTSFLADRFSETNTAVLKAVALMIQKNLEGDIGLLLRDYPAKVMILGDEVTEVSDEIPKIYGENDWEKKIQESQNVSDGSKPTPLVYENGRLYLRKYWVYESELSAMILERAATLRDYKAGHIRDIIGRLFPLDSSQTDWQAVACLVSATRNFSVITGGPGTGKTYTVLRLLSLLIELEHKKNPISELSIALAAPTGKAAARVTQSIQESIKKLPADSSVKSQIPDKALTLHRLLGYKRHQVDFRHNAQNLLPHDVVIVDEASMIDLAMMYRLISAVRKDALLVLIGDKDQLSSVEAGAVLGDICASENADLNTFYSKTRELVQKCGIRMNGYETVDQNELRNAITELRVSRRFSDEAEIGKLAKLINDRNATDTMAVLKNPQMENIQLESPGKLPAILNDYVKSISKLAQMQDPQAAFTLMERQQILCAHRRGKMGTVDLNYKIEARLKPSEGKYVHSDFYPGKIVMVTGNDYNNKLYNGDMGVTLWNSVKNRLEVWFKKNEEDKVNSHYRAYTSAQISGYESGFAISVHKSQGSEFENVILILPPKISPVLTKELIYTALTRSRNSFTVLSDESVLREAVSRAVERSSGLKQRLWGMGRIENLE